MLVNEFVGVSQKKNNAGNVFLQYVLNKKIMSKIKECDTHRYSIFDMFTHAVNKPN